MLGHDASFGYINAINYAEQSAVLDKKTGIESTPNSVYSCQ